MSTKKTYLTVVTVVVLLSVAVPLLVLHKPWKGTKVATSELYNRYADKKGIEASFIKDYKVNDSVFVDITVLEARDSAGWKLLKEEFGIFDAKDLPPEEREIYNTYFNQSIVLKKAPPGKYSQQPDTNTINNDVIAYELAERRVSVFHTASTTIRRSTTNYLYNQMISKNSLNIQNHEEEH